MARSRFIPQAPISDTEEIRTLALADITVEGVPYAREHTNYGTVWEYMAFYEEDIARLPPLDVFCIDGRYVLSDGFHRYDAAQKAGLTTLPCRICTGTMRDVYLHAVEVNGRQHGLAYDTGDYLRIIRWFLADDEFATVSHRELAKRIGCSHTYVNRVAKTMQAEATVAQALETVSTQAKTPEGQRRQRLAGLLQVPSRAVKPAQAEAYTSRLVRAVQAGQTVEQAVTALRAAVTPVTPVTQVAPSVAPPEPSPPSAAAVALSERLASALCQQIGLGGMAAPSTGWCQDLVTSVLTGLVTEDTGYTQRGRVEIAPALDLAMGQARLAVRVQMQVLQQWLSALSLWDMPSILRAVVEQLTAQRYQHPPAAARIIGQSIASLEAYLKEHAPTSTTHPARREVEL